jgi:heme exporter protein C
MAPLAQPSPAAVPPPRNAPRASLGPAWLVSVLLLASAFVAHILYIFLVTPSAQEEAGGFAQKILYFHAPSAYGFYLAGAACFVASARYLVMPSLRSNAWAQASAEVALMFGLMVLTSGPLWGKKAWGLYWTWDPRLTTMLLSVLLYAAMLIFRRFVGNGDAERRFAAAFGVLGSVLLPIIHYAVRLWGGNHPTVISKGGGGLASPEMKWALGIGFLTMTALAVMLLMLRARTVWLVERTSELEEELLSREDISPDE